MTTGIDPEPTDWRQRWAATQLAVDPAAPAAEVRAAILGRLAENDFVLSPDLRQAVRTLVSAGAGGPSLFADDAAYRDEAEQKRREVESFAESFWSEAPPERRRRWEELRKDCDSFPDLRARLRELGPGVDLATGINPDEEPAVRELAEHFQRLFTLRPAARAEATRELLEAMQSNRAGWQAVARKLNQRHLRIADLLPGLVLELAHWKSKHARQRRTKRRLPVKWVWVAGGLAMLLRFMALSSAPPSRLTPREYQRNHPPPVESETLRRLGQATDTKEAQRVLQEEMDKLGTKRHNVSDEWLDKTDPRQGTKGSAPPAQGQPRPPDSGVPPKKTEPGSKSP